MDPYRNRSCAVHDHAWSRPLLRRPRALQKRLIRYGAVLWHRLHGFHIMGRLPLQPLLQGR